MLVITTLKTRDPVTEVGESPQSQLVPRPQPGCQREDGLVWRSGYCVGKTSVTSHRKRSYRSFGGSKVYLLYDQRGRTPDYEGLTWTSLPEASSGVWVRTNREGTGV